MSRVTPDDVNFQIRYADAEPAPKPVSRPLPLLDAYLSDQQDLTAVERFSQFHDRDAGVVQEPYYRSLIPLSTPGPGQQYSFEVDLDRCSGCKACVTACHSLNGLEAGETWRSVGLLHGGTAEAPMQKTVTTACHHCLEPACMHGCPVGAYEKDALTGIVHHLDDQCIGCQYCVFTCPYEVPQYSAKKGIVRKCDMCAGRLFEGEAPACVQACPTEAISIRIVDKMAVVEDAQGDAFLPGVPSPGITVPTTHYKTDDVFPRNMLPADFYAVRLGHQHLPLMVMLVLTQLSVGAFCVNQMLPLWLSDATLAVLRPFHSVLALALGVLAMVASTAHLGRPRYAWRAFIGLRTSWLSREIIAFGAFAAMAALYALVLYLGRWSAAESLGRATALTGAAAVFCSVMLYHVTRRRWRSGGRTSFKFALTAAGLGWASILFSTFGVAMGRGAPLSAELIAFGLTGAQVLAVLALIKLAGEASVFFHLRDRQQGDLKRTAILLWGDLRMLMQFRFLLGVLGGILLPLGLLTNLSPSSLGQAFVGSFLSLLCLLVGDFIERTTFFSALSAPRMPGGLQ
ncbi:MAG: dimethyl sulfoxide reductase anchor subunit [Candidatus Tectomicrobia bacterium]|nr:dimethyl sulfoxide reductase anchor subunit [Candidatus Tectomicrobia bacterium]